MRSYVSSAISALILVCFSVAANSGQQIKTEAFAALPLIQSASLSPSGNKVALIVNVEGTSTIVVQELNSASPKRISIAATDNKQFNFNWIRWVSDERILISSRFPAKRQQSSRSVVGGLNTNETRLLSAKVDGSQPISLFKPTSFRGQYQAQFQDRIVDLNVDNGKHVLIQVDRIDSNSGYPSVYSLDVEDGSRTHVHSAQEGFNHWIADTNHKIRVGRFQDKNNVEIHACDPDGKNWRKLWSYKLLSLEAMIPLGFGKDPNQLYVLADKDGRRALFTVDLITTDLKKTLKLESKTNDIEGQLVFSKQSGDVVGLAGVAMVGKSEITYWGEEQKDLLSAIDLALPGKANRLISQSDNGDVYLVSSGNSKTPTEIYIGDQKANSLKLLTSTYPALSPKNLAAKQLINIEARDGLKLPTYLTTPLGTEPKNLPMVLLVHGGPQSNDSYTFDSWTQFFANRGYAVLQVNFRGSTFYGYKLMSEGLRKWGQEAQDDLSDAVTWTVKQGIADPKRICVVGGSYGGYTALVGVAKTPDLFRCAVSFAGVSDLLELGSDTALFRDGKAAFETQVGSIDKDKAVLRSNSPRFMAAQIKAPVLLFHGTQDLSVAFEQSQMMDDALTAAGVPHRFIRQEGGDHHLSVYKDRLQFFEETEKFLEEFLSKSK